MEVFDLGRKFPVGIDRKLWPEGDPELVEIKQPVDQLFAHHAVLDVAQRTIFELWEKHELDDTDDGLDRNELTKTLVQ